MGHRFAELAFTSEVKKIQTEMNSRSGYASMEQGEDFNYLLSAREADFIEARDSFYMASVSETGWPYVQHRGGPAGFLRVLDAKTIGFADFSGNRQYISTGNFKTNDKVALILMDYPNRTRLKILGRVRTLSATNNEELNQLELPDYRARIERGFIIKIEAFDWNCPQHITPKYSESDIQNLIAPLTSENTKLKAELLAASQQSTAVKEEGAPLKVLGEGPLQLIVSGIRQLTTRVRAFELRSPEGLDLPEIDAGAHLQIPVKNPHGEVEFRNYSICSNPSRRDIYEIAVLREESAMGLSQSTSETSSSVPFSGSAAVHEQFALGLIINCAMPLNHFRLHEDRRTAILIAGGIGITPIKSMAQHLQYQQREFSIHYAGRGDKEMAFFDRLQREFKARLFDYKSDENQRLDISKILANAPKTAVFYVCGPERLINAVTSQAEKQGIAANRIRYERFHSPKITHAKTVHIKLERSKVAIEVKPEQSILDAIIEAGIAIPFSCKTGACKSCAVKVIDGVPEHEDVALSDQEKTTYRLMCPCVSRAKTTSLTLDL